MQYSGITKTPALACSPNKKEWAKPVLYLIGFFGDHFKDNRSFFLLKFSELIQLCETPYFNIAMDGIFGAEWEGE